MSPGRVNCPAPPAVNLVGELLADLCQRLIGQGDQMKVIHGNGCPGQPHPQRFPERRRGVNRDDLYPAARTIH